MNIPPEPRQHIYQGRCWCVDIHEDDSYGACTVCRHWISHTEDTYVGVAFPCPTYKLAQLKRDAEKFHDFDHHGSASFEQCSTPACVALRLVLTE